MGSTLVGGSSMAHLGVVKQSGTSLPQRGRSIIVLPRVSCCRCRRRSSGYLKAVGIAGGCGAAPVRSGTDCCAAHGMGRVLQGNQQGIDGHNRLTKPQGTALRFGIGMKVLMLGTLGRRNGRYFHNRWIGRAQQVLQCRQDEWIVVASQVVEKVRNGYMVVGMHGKTPSLVFGNDGKFTRCLRQFLVASQHVLTQRPRRFSRNDTGKQGQTVVQDRIHRSCRCVVVVVVVIVLVAGR